MQSTSAPVPLSPYDRAALSGQPGLVETTCYRQPGLNKRTAMHTSIARMKQKDNLVYVQIFRRKRWLSWGSQGLSMLNYGGGTTQTTQRTLLYYTMHAFPTHT